jgi:gamma-glutamyltranspeptidase / glutathione hydrolase
MIADIVDFKMSPVEAVSKPRFHHQWLPDEIQVEKGFPENIAKQLRQMGYSVVPYSVAGYESSIGRVELIQYDKGKLKAVADVRGDDSVAGF